MDFRKLSNVLLDTSGMGLGIFLVGLGRWALVRGFDGPFIWYVVIFLGISAFLIHFVRYVGWKPIRRWFGL